MRREYYSDTIPRFMEKSASEILGELVESDVDGTRLEHSQKDAWIEQIRILKENVQPRPA